MFLGIHELERHPIAFDQVLGPGCIDFGEEMTQVATLEIHGSAELVKSDIRLRGSLRTAVEAPCARCLEPTRRPVALDFDLFYSPIETISKEGEVEMETAGLDIGFYHGNGLLLEDVIQEQVLLALPVKITCRPDCAGLCPQCGQNRNLGQCRCLPIPRDDRWSPLGKLKELG